MVATFLWIDYTVFTLLLMCSTSVGIYYGFIKKQLSGAEYMLGGKKMNIWPIGLSLVSSAIPGVPFVSYPVEVYRFGINIALATPFIIIIVMVVNYVYLPIFYKLHITSMYEYFEIRFDKKIRLLSSVFNTLHMLVAIPLAAYIPSLVLSQATGIPTYITNVILCITCTFYTAIGGIRTVVWTDVFQLFFMYSSILLLVISGIVKVGSLDSVFERNTNSGRLHVNFDVNFTQETFWSGGIGHFFFWMYTIGLNQNTIQKCMAVRSLENGKRAMVIFGILTIVLVGFIFFLGLVIYAYFYNCDPIFSKQILKYDQLVPLYAFEITQNIPGYGGLFVAGIVSAGLSTMSSSMNCLATTLYQDFIKLFISKNTSDKVVTIYLKLMVTIIGIIALCLVYIYEHMGTILMFAITLISVSAGPNLGLFSIGMFAPFVNSLSVFIGGVSSLCAMLWIALSAQMYRSTHPHPYIPLPTSTDGCVGNITIANVSLLLTNNTSSFVLYKISYNYFTLIGFLLLVFITIVTSILLRCFKKNKQEVVPKDSIMSFMHFLIPKGDDYSLVKQPTKNRENKHKPFSALLQ